MIVTWLIELLIVIAINIIAMVLMSKPKSPKPAAAQDLEEPTAEAGRPIPVFWGTIVIKGLNVLWFGDKSQKSYEIKT